MTKTKIKKVKITFECSITDEFEDTLVSMIDQAMSTVNCNLNMLRPEGYNSMVSPYVKIKNK